MRLQRQAVLAIVFATLATAACVRGAGSGRSDSPAGNTELAALLRCNDRAVGGPALRSINEVSYDLTISEPTFTVTGHYTAVRGREVRIDIFAGDERVYSEGWDGTAGWQLPRKASERIPSSPEGAAALRHGLEQPGHLWTLADMPTNGHRVEVAPRDGRDPAGTAVLKLTLEDGAETWYWLDAASCLVVRSRGFHAFHPDVDSTRKWTETRYTDFEVHDGVTRPMMTYNIDVVSGDTIGRTRVLAVNARRGTGVSR
jgi:hypothetical protein